MPMIVPSSHTRIGAWINSKMSGRNPLVYCTIPLTAMQGYHTKTEDTGNLGYNSICSITSRIGWVSFIYLFIFVRKNPRSFDCTEIRTLVPTSEGLEATIWTHRGYRRQEIILYLPLLINYTSYTTIKIRASLFPFQSFTQNHEYVISTTNNTV